MLCGKFSQFLSAATFPSKSEDSSAMDGRSGPCHIHDLLLVSVGVIWSAGYLSLTWTSHIELVLACLLRAV